MLRSRLFIFGLTLAGAISGSTAQRPESASTDLPSRLTDQEFWRLIEDLSEPEGKYPDDNLLSNELLFAQLVPQLAARIQPGGVYLGVGPEQNFSYIAAVKPRFAFIPDIRRGNLRLQLMYKALFELSNDRAEFVSRLFTKKRPPGLTSTSSSRELMDAFWEAHSADEAAFTANLKALTDRLTKDHTFPLPAEDLDGIARAYRAFYWYGPRMNPGSNLSLALGAERSGGPTYRDVMTEVNASGQGVGFLGSEEQFAVVKDLQSRNLVVPVVGNFSGPRALRAIGRYLKDHRATVGVFYLSNVESYLRRDGSWPTFCANVKAMPLTEASVFIRVLSVSLTLYLKGIPGPSKPSKAEIVPIVNEIKNCLEALQ